MVLTGAVASNEYEFDNDEFDMEELERIELEAEQKIKNPIKFMNSFTAKYTSTTTSSLPKNYKVPAKKNTLQFAQSVNLIQKGDGMKQTTMFESLGINKPPQLQSKQITPVIQNTNLAPLASSPSSDEDENEKAHFPHRINTDKVNTWTYPTNKPIRSYQQAIVKTCLFYNTLVSVPTGLGKTFIAAVVMYNYFDWFPDSKIMFVAPTKPLVSQQIDACHSITGLSPYIMQELNGHVSVDKRREMYICKRIFFMTPQTLFNDLANGTTTIHSLYSISLRCMSCRTHIPSRC